MNSKLEKKLKEYFRGFYVCRLADEIRSEADEIDNGSLERDQHLILEKALRLSAKKMVDQIGMTEACDGIYKEVFFDELDRFDENNDINPLIYLWFNKTPMRLEIETTDNSNDTIVVSPIMTGDTITVIDKSGEICCCNRYKVISRHPKISFDLEGELVFEFEELEKKIIAMIKSDDYGVIRANIDLLFTGRMFVPLNPEHERDEDVFKYLNGLCSEYESVVYKNNDGKLIKGIYRPGKQSSLPPGSYIASNDGSRNIHLKYRSNSDYPPESYIEFLIAKGSAINLDLCAGSELILNEDGLKLNLKGKVVR